MSRRIIEVRIDELALDGVQPTDREGVAEATSRELTRLLGTSNAWAGGPTSVDVDADELARGGGTTPDALGVDVARAVHGRLVR